MNADPLSELRDIHLPEAISWWPPAVGWWLLLLIVVCLVVAVMWWKRRSEVLKNKPVIYSHMEIIDAALAELSQLQYAMKAGGNPKKIASDLSRLLRRSAMRLSANQADVAGLTGEKWLLWLDEQWDKDEFHNGAGRQLIQALYRPESHVDIEAAFRLCHGWLEAQR